VRRTRVCAASRRAVAISSDRKWLPG
jgi:hypothetical protein